MKRIIIIALLATAYLTHAQTPLPIEISYDAAGNRITRKVFQVSKMLRGGSLSDSSYYLDQMQSIQMKVFPNPTQGKVYVELYEAEANVSTNIRILDNLGRLIYEKREEGSAIELDLSHYPAGYYIVELSANNEHTTWKIIKK